MAKDKYISLKEAAALSGYSADYVGQLIRSGKLEGKQIFLNVAWMTTEEAIQEYLQKQKKGSTPTSPLLKIKERLLSVGFIFTYRVVLWIAIVVLVAFALLLIYVSSVSIDHRIDRTYQQKIQHP